MSKNETVKKESTYERYFKSNKSRLSAVFLLLYRVRHHIYYYRGGVINLLGSVLAVAMIVIGAVYLGSFFLNFLTNGFSVFLGIMILAVGIWFLLQPAVIVSLIPIVIGVLLLFHGIRALKEILEARKFGFRAWGAGLILAIVSIVCGLICVFDAFGVMEKAVILVGIILIFNGVSNLWITLSASHAEKEYHKYHDPIDGTFREDRD